METRWGEGGGGDKRRAVRNERNERLTCLAVGGWLDVRVPCVHVRTRTLRTFLPYLVLHVPYRSYLLY